MSTEKQKLAQHHNWNLAQIRGASGTLRRICIELGLSGTESALKKIGLKMEKTNKEIFTSKRARL